MTEGSAGVMRFSSDSLLCSRSQPQQLIASSSTAGWTSLLIEELVGHADSDVFDTPTTPDIGIVVGLAGEHRLHSFRDSVWSSALYQAGAVGMTLGNVTNRLRLEMVNRRCSFRTAHLYLPAALMEETADEYRRAGSRNPHANFERLVFNDPFIANAAASLLTAMSEGAPDFYAETAARWMAAHLLKTHMRGSASMHEGRRTGPISDRRLARVVEHMSANLAQPLSLRDLADEAAVSQHHFSRLFRAKIGVSPYSYLLQLRMECAVQLLETSDLSVAQIAGHCGYSSAGAFATAFTRRFGSPPRKHRWRRGS